MIRAKLRDNTGASITYALLLFLVCAVVGSVVLAAGTAAAGRMSQAVDGDRRYYAVTSAVRALKEELNGNSNTIVFNYNGSIKDGIIDEEKLSPIQFDKKSISGDITYGITDYASAVVGKIVSGSEVELSFSVNGNSDLVAVKDEKEKRG